MSTIDVPIRSVFDCNVLLQAMVNPIGPAGACLDRVRRGQITLFLSGPILSELIEVTARPVLIRKFALSLTRTTAFIEELLAYSVLFEAVPSVFVHPIDPKDSMYVDLAVASDAHLITTRDRHLLSLRDSSDRVGVDFISRFPNIEVLTPVQLLQRFQTI